MLVADEGKEKKTNRELLIDGHAHLEELDDLLKSLQEAKEAGVCGILAVGMDVESNKNASQFFGIPFRY